MKLAGVKKSIEKIGSRGLLLAKKHSPEALAVGGVIFVGAGVVLACKSTIKAKDILDEHKGTIEQIHLVKNHVDEQTDSESPEDIEYTETDYKKDLTIAYVRTGLDLVKCYAPAAVLVIGGVGCLLGAQGILSKRNVALMAAYKGLEESYGQYRDRVVEALGADKDKEFYNGIIEEEVEEEVEGKDGKTKKTKKKVKVVEEGCVSPYARFFDDASPYFEKDHSRNLFFLNQVQESMNNRLKYQGHVFLNEVYDELGIPRDSVGAISGWIYDSDNPNTDNYIDFGIYDVNRRESRDFVNGYQEAILLDFNVEGIIYDLI